MIFLKLSPSYLQVYSFWVKMQTIIAANTRNSRFISSSSGKKGPNSCSFSTYSFMSLSKTIIVANTRTTEGDKFFFLVVRHAGVEMKMR